MRIQVAPVIAILLAGCGAPVSQFAGHDELFDATYQHIAVVDSTTHRTDRTLDLGVPSPDWTHLYSVNLFTLVDIEPANGTVRRTFPIPNILPDRYVLPATGMSGLPGGISQNGRWLVLEAFDSSSNPPHRTRLLIVDTAGGTTKAIELQGTWEFDAISNDGARVYLLEYLIGNQYRVRVYLVGEQRLDPRVVVDKTDPKESMTGVRLGGLASKDGVFQYTLYARENESAFIHALLLDGSQLAFCIDLPGSGYASTIDEFHWSLAMNPAGTTLYAVNPLMGLASEISIAGSAPQLVRTVHINSGASASEWLAQKVEAKEFAANTLAISPDGRTLVSAGKTGLEWIDARTLTVRRHALDGWTVWSVGLSGDGARVYAIRDNGQIAQVATDSGNVISIFNPLEGQPMALMRVASA